MTRFAAAMFVSTVLATTPALANKNVSSDAPIAPNAAGCKMTYGGGPMIQHVKVFDVFYSPGNPNVAKFGDFYTAVTQSAHFDMLSEYNVTNYKISRGSYIGKFEDTHPNPATITAIDPQQYLAGLIAAGKVPAPDNDTYYMLYFPSNIDPLFVDGTTHSCITARTYCAYHNSYQQAGGQLVRYGVMPDVNANGCAGGCGNGQPFDNLTLVSSHELIESVTDPDNNTAWVDRANACSPSGEIGDICATGGASEVGTMTGFTVQKEWSNALGQCVVSNPNIVINDFSLGAASTVNVPQGGSAMVMLTLTKVSGTAENVALSTAAPPTGLTAAFNPSSVTSAGGATTLTISAAPTAALGMSTITVKAAGSVVSRQQNVAINVVSAPDMAMPPSGTGGGGSGGSGGGSGVEGGGGSGGSGSGGSGGNGATHAMSGCSMTGAGVGGGWLLGAALLLGCALRRRNG